MAKPSIANIVVHRVTKVSDGPPARYNWDISYDSYTSLGTKNEHHQSYANLSKGELWSAIRQVAIAEDTAESTPPAPPVAEFPDRYDATANNLIPLAPADYPA